ncbi:MAG TPA: hypothetical protein PKN48_11860 [Bacteroidales bacterium]|nr:hypothetical protein [Bacteroidales bacterium]
MKSLKSILLILSFFSILISCNDKQSQKETISASEEGYMLPRVLIITTGSNQGNGVLAEGITVAMQTFNQLGAFVTLKSRDILLDPEELSTYNIMLLLTAAGYHDADRRYSLTYMSDEELKTILNWVKKGGILVAGDNIGRNLPDATDRTSLYGIITPGNWSLGECFGVSLVEKDMKGYRIDGFITDELKGNFIPEFKEDIWALVVDTVNSDSAKVLANWISTEDSIPALVQNRYKKGMCFLLPTSYLLHPANAGGYWGSEQIRIFYQYVLASFYKINRCSFRLNIWPDAHRYAFCATLNSAGSLSEYKRVMNFFNTEKITPTIFVNEQPDSTIREFLKACSLQSNGFMKLNNQTAQYYEISKNIISNEKFWNQQFAGFRFPFTKSSYLGFECLSGRKYRFDSSIGVDNLENFYGSAFPYDICISGNGLYKYTDMLEISPILNDDYFFFEKVLNGNYSDGNIVKDAKLYQKYLMNTWEYAIKPYNGLMVYLGHPLYVGHSDSTMVPLIRLIEKVKSENTWITTMESVASYWEKLGKTRFIVNENEESSSITVRAPDSLTIKNISIATFKKPTLVEALKGSASVIDKDHATYIVFDAVNEQRITVHY